MSKRLQGRVAIVTGGGRGIGRAEALALAAEGASVVVNDFGGAADGSGHDLSPAAEVVAEIEACGGNAIANAGDVSSFSDAATMVRQAVDTFGRLDILVNNAGFLRDRMVYNMLEDEWDAIIAVHLKGHFNLIRHAGVVFRQQRSGVIVNTSSESGLGNMGQANYSAAKEGIVGLTRTVARDLGRYGVRCNAIRPRAATRLTAAPELQEAVKRAMQSGAPVPPELANIAAFLPEDVAPFVVWLCADEATEVNGCVFLVGGRQISLYREPELVRSVFVEDGWTVDKVADVLPKTLLEGLVNKWRAQAPKES